jgi:hypothetical protein
MVKPIHVRRAIYDGKAVKSFFPNPSPFLFNLPKIAV